MKRRWILLAVLGLGAIGGGAAAFLLLARPAAEPAPIALRVHSFCASCHAFCGTVCAMTIQLTNTLGGRKEAFEPREPGKVRMYHCGPTIKEPLNIAKFRSFLLADVLRRHLEYSGYEVTQVMNITDVGHLNEFEEDIVEIAAARTGLYAWELVEKEEKTFHDDRKALRIADATSYPKAREHIDDMVAVIQDLEQKGFTYKAGGNVYFDIAKSPGFGRLAARSPGELEKLLQTGRRPPHPEKRHALDIDLWRTDVLHQMHWPSPWGRGFPGWHVECVAMGRKYLGESFDIHTGTWENVFPHHECEIAQAEAVSGKPLARYWLHSGPVTVDGRPMSLQNKNVVTARELLEAGFRGAVIRAALLSTPYRAVLDFGEAAMDRARKQVNAILGFHEHLASLGGEAAADVETCAGWIQNVEAAFRLALDDDLDFGRALTAVTDRIESLDPAKVGCPAQALEALRRWDRVLGVL
jgi:cysteinyl-tRNA synthetase